MKQIETGQPAPGQGTADQGTAHHGTAHQVGADQGGAEPAVVVKKYANRRLYNTESSSYITLDNLAEMVRAGRDFIVYDARTGDDITRSVLTQIIVDEESKGRALLPTTFLRQLIGFYGESLGGVVPRYLEQTMSAIARQQEQMRDAMQQTIGTLLPPPLAEMRRHNMAMVERAMTLFSPFYRHPDPLAPGNQSVPPGIPPAPPAMPDPIPSAAVAPSQAEIQALKVELEHMRQLLAASEAAQLPGRIAPPAAAPTPAASLASSNDADGIDGSRVVAQLRPKRQEPSGG